MIIVLSCWLKARLRLALQGFLDRLKRELLCCNGSRLSLSLYFVLCRINETALCSVQKLHRICVITRCAETGRGPPATGVMVSAAAFPAGFLTVKTELIEVVSTIAIPMI